MAAIDLDQLLAQLNEVRGPDGQGRFMAFCPFHPETGRSLRIFPTGSARCFGACQRRWNTKEFAEALGVKVQGPAPTAVEAVYSYEDAEGRLIHQVVRRAGKKFSQRHPDAAQPDGWAWNVIGVSLVLYHTPALVAAKPEDPVFVLEGEKDADRLVSLGFVTTTNAQGAGKWRKQYSRQLRDRYVVILPDNDPAGEKHAQTVARSLYGLASTIKIVPLPNLPLHGDVSDWLAAGGTKEQLLELVEEASDYIPTHTNGAAPIEALEKTTLLYEGSKWAPVSRRIINEGLLSHGWFLMAEDRSYFFDEDSKILCDIEGFDMAVLLKERYGINQVETLYSYLVKDMLVEAKVRGKKAIVRSFAYYDPDRNVLCLDLGDGRMLRIDGTTPTITENGKDGVLFTPAPNSEPWTYELNAPRGCLNATVIESLNFASSDNTPHTPDEQKVLMLLWLLAIPFESIQPTKPLALAMGPAGSGKSNVFRRIGQLLFGVNFNVDGLQRDKEEDFFVATTTRPFVAFDNVDKRVPWLEDALATSATGMRITKRVLYRTNEAISYVPRSFIALTARTPRFRRDDVAERLIIFHLERIAKKRPEYQLFREIQDQRNTLMSDYANMLNQVVATPRENSMDTSIRLADFAAMAARIGTSLGIAEQTAVILEKLKESQYLFATEDSTLFLLLDAWFASATDSPQMDMGLPPGVRKVKTSDLFNQLKEIAAQMGIKWYYSGAHVLGRDLTNMMEPLSLHFNIRHESNRSGKFWIISPAEKKVELVSE